MNDDITIEVTNATGENLNICVFQQDPDISGMFDTIYPVAWKVYPLGDSSTESTIYPIALQLGIDETNTPYNFDGRATIKTCRQGDLWEFAIDENNFNSLSKEGANANDPTVNCLNLANKPVDISLYKNNSPLLTQSQVGKNAVAAFKLTPKIYVMWSNNLREQDIIKSFVRSNIAQEVDLTGIKSVHLTLNQDTNTKEKIWSYSMTTI